MEKKKQKDTVVKRVNDWLCVYQNTTDSYFNATQFLKDFNEHNPNNWKRFQEFFKLDSTKNLIAKYETKQLEKAKVRNHTFGDNQQITAFYVKKGRALKRGGRTPDIYFFCKELFFEFGCWLSVDLRLDLYEIVWDNVVEYRNNLKGKFSKEFTDAVQKIEPNPLYPKLYSCLNKTVFGKNINGENQRDSATEEQLKLMYKIENEIITLIEWNYIKTFEEILEHFYKYRSKE